MKISNLGVSVLFCVASAAILLVLVGGSRTAAGDLDKGRAATEEYAPADASSLVYVTEDYYPYNFEHNGRMEGFSVDLLRLAWKEMGVPESPISIYPWARGYEMLQKEPGTVLFSVARIPERESLFKWACPINVVRFVLVARKDRGIKVDSRDDLHGYTIGTVRDDITESTLMQMDRELNIESVADMRSNMEKLDIERVDLVAYEEGSLHKFLVRNGYDPQKYESVFVIKETQVCFAMHPDTPDDLVERFQSALTRARESEDFDKVHEKYLE